MNRAAALQPVQLLDVEMDLGGTLQPVGRLALHDRQIWFEYAPAFVALGLETSPVRLPLRQGQPVAGPREPAFERLHGVFSDSLPDGWGRLLMDRKLRQIGVEPGAMSALDRLAYLGSRGMGALRYRPEYPATVSRAPLDLDALAESALKVLEDAPDVVIDQLLELGGSPAGACPKALLGRSRDGTRLVHGVAELRPGYEHWLVKFLARDDAVDAGAVEHAYAAMATAAGIDMPETALFPSRKGPGYFGIRRFDRVGNRRVHVLTVSGFLEADWTNPSLEYGDVLKATRYLTRNQVDVDKMFARMVFNVLAQNRDAHPKNHAFVLGEDGTWSLSPAYDITYSTGPGGEHALSVGGEGKSPTVDHIYAVARAVGVHDETAKETVGLMKAVVASWSEFAQASGVSKHRLAEIDLRLNGSQSPRPRANRKTPLAETKTPKR